MKSEPSAPYAIHGLSQGCGSFSGVSIGIGVCATALAFLLLRCIALFHQLVLLPSLQLRVRLSSPAGSRWVIGW